MNAARALTITVYAVAYGAACYAGTEATETGDALSAAALFSTSAGLLLGIRREAGHAARTAAAHPPSRCSCATAWTTHPDAATTGGDRP